MPLRGARVPEFVPWLGKALELVPHRIHKHVLAVAPLVAGLQLRFVSTPNFVHGLVFSYLLSKSREMHQHQRWCTQRQYTHPLANHIIANAIPETVRQMQKEKDKMQRRSDGRLRVQ